MLYIKNLNFRDMKKYLFLLLIILAMIFLPKAVKYYKFAKGVQEDITKMQEYKTDFIKKVFFKGKAVDKYVRHGNYTCVIKLDTIFPDSIGFHDKYYYDYYAFSNDLDTLFLKVTKDVYTNIRTNKTTIIKESGSKKISIEHRYFDITDAWKN